MTNTTEAALRDAANKLAEMPVKGLRVGEKPYVIMHALDRDALVDLLIATSQPSPASSTAGEVREIVERMAYGYELMFRAICNIVGTSGERESWYRTEANKILARVDPLHSLSADSNPHKPGDCLTQYKRFAAPSSGEPASVAVEAIPELVYWSDEGGNFYGMVSHRGQGQDFFAKWYPRREEFPTSPHEDDKPLAKPTGEATCLCGGKGWPTDDGHAVNCPAHVGYYNYLALSKPTPVEAGLREALDAPLGEKVCMDCHGHNPVWFAPNEVWNFVIGGPEAKGDPGGFYCPNCFIARAEKVGVVPSAWKLEPENIVE